MDEDKAVLKSKTETVILGLGSNLGNRLDNIIFAIEKLAEQPKITIKACSSIYESKAVGFMGHNFYNLTIAISCSVPPLALLDVTQKIEISTGRKRNKKGIRTTKYASRKIDIDILYYGNIILNTARLIVPHPEINNRLFVTKPLLDLNFLLTSFHIDRQETNTILLENQEILRLIEVSKQLKKELKRKQLLK